MCFTPQFIAKRIQNPKELIQTCSDGNTCAIKKFLLLFSCYFFKISNFCPRNEFNC